MAFPTLAATQTGELASGTPQTLTLPAGVAANNLLVALIADGSSTTHTWPAGWTEMIDLSGRTIGYRIADGSEGATIDVANNLTGGQDASYVIHRFSGGSFLIPQQANANFGNTSAPDPPNLAPTWPQTDVMWCAITMANNSSGLCGGVFPTNYNDNQLEFAHSGGGLSGAINFATRNLNAASEDPGAYPLLGVGTRVVTLGIALSTPSLVYNSRRNHHLLVR